MTVNAPHPDLSALSQLFESFRARAALHDREGSFVEEHYPRLKELHFFSLLVPEALGGRGVSYSALANFLREAGQHCGSTALALSMHSHLVANTLFRHSRGGPGEPLLRKVAASELVLVSTGAGDWLDSVGRAERTPDGYRIYAKKRFCSGSEAGDMLVTSAPLATPEGTDVVHFAVPLKGEGVRLERDWDTLGMRGTGSHTVVLDGVSVPEGAISARRPQGKWAPLLDVIVLVAPPLYMAPYVGVAERASELAIGAMKSRASGPSAERDLGRLMNHLRTAQLAHRGMLTLTDELRANPNPELSAEMLSYKSLVSTSCLAVVEQALELVGGSSFYRTHELERLWRDIQGARFHPLPVSKQEEFAGRLALGLTP